MTSTAITSFFGLALAATGCTSTAYVPVSDGSSDSAVAAPMDFSSLQGSDLPLPLVDMTMAMTVYPPGPYGNTVGDTLPPLVWEGYVVDAGDAVATSKPYGAYSMDALRRSGRAFALIHTAEFY